MQRYGTLCIALLLTLTTGCTAIQEWAGKPETATRIAAGQQCLDALVQQGIRLAADSTLGFTTASQVLAAVLTIGNAAIQIALNQACRDTIALASEDASGATAMLNAATTTPEPVKAQLKAKMRAAAPAKAAPGPVRVIVPLR